jgi:hypothetical protein
VRRIWRRHGLKPHRVETFKISNDPEFAEKTESGVCQRPNPDKPALANAANKPVPTMTAKSIGLQDVLTISVPEAILARSARTSRFCSE